LPYADVRFLYIMYILYIISGMLHAIGGYDGQDRLSTVEVFEQDAKRWKKVASMNCKRR
jgi:kelch-like protein 18